MKNIIVKQKGFTIIELMIVVAIVSILLTFLIPAFQDSSEDDDVDTVFEEVLDAPIEHIRNDLRLNDGSITLIRHTDGTVWGCFKDSKNCYRVTE